MSSGTSLRRRRCSSVPAITAVTTGSIIRSLTADAMATPVGVRSRPAGREVHAAQPAEVERDGDRGEGDQGQRRRHDLATAVRANLHPYEPIPTSRDRGDPEKSV